MAMNDTDVMLSALKKEREQAHQRVMQLDRIIKQVKDGKYLTNSTTPDNNKDSKQPVRIEFPQKADLKVQILRVFDIIRKATRLNDVQAEYNRLNGNPYPLRDTIRSLQSSKLLVLIKEKTATRGFLWAKADWIENGQLLDEYKPEGFDMIYKPENLIYE
jgi:hypothetical protein